VSHTTITVVIEVAGGLLPRRGGGAFGDTAPLTVDHARLLKLLAEQPHARNQPHGREYFNPWFGDEPAAEQRRRNLVEFVNSRQSAPILLVAEAPGHRGCAKSGVPLTDMSELSGDGEQEQTARYVYDALRDFGILNDVVMWNVFPFHPHYPGRLDTNRSPSEIECKKYAHFVHLFAPNSRRLVVGVGTKAKSGLSHVGIQAFPVRHPSHGGKKAFRSGLRALLDK